MVTDAGRRKGGGEDGEKRRGERRPKPNDTDIHLDKSSKTSSNPASFIQFSMIGTVLWFVADVVGMPDSSGTFRLLLS
jgi:hypothetical protein